MRPALEEARRRAHEAARETLEVLAEDLAGRAARDAPIETGTLRASVSPGPGGPLVTREQPGRIEVEVSFSTPYAARIHEEVTWKHPLGGKAKYLEGALLQMGPRYQAVLAEKVRRAFGGG